MDWFHCNRCYRQQGGRFWLTSCGHILCSACQGAPAGSCAVCAASCCCLRIGPQLPPQQKLFLHSPTSLALKHLTHICQVWRFQRGQCQLRLQRLQEAAGRAKAQLGQAQSLLQDRDRELQSLRQENSELRRAQLSPHWWGGSRNSTPRPIGVTSPSQSGPSHPRRQLSGEVVSRSSPASSSSPLWQVGGARTGVVTPLATALGSAQAPPFRTTPRTTPTPLWFPPWATPPPQRR